MKTHPKTLAVCAVLLLCVAVLVLVRQQTFAQFGDDSANLNTVSFNLTSAQLDPLEGNNVIRAFVPTGSKSHDCLTSLNEIRTDAYPTQITMFCDGRLRQGYLEGRLTDSERPLLARPNPALDDGKDGMHSFQAILNSR